jgi:iron(III) transport system permease protein
VAPLVRPKLGRDDWTMRAFLVLVGLYLVVTLALPLGMMLAKSLQSGDGRFVGVANYVQYFKTPALSYSIPHSFHIAIVSTFITVPLAFLYAYALTRSRMPARGLFKTVAFIPILVPSLLPGIALVYLFGNQGMLRGLMFGHSIYGPIGIVMAEVFFTFPHAFLIIATALALADARLYEAAVALRASRPRIFLTVTLPGARYGLVSAIFVVFTMVITDFGAPKVIGGQYNVLATDVYKQVIGQSNFQMGAVVSVVLLIPAAFAFVADRVARRRQVALLSARAVPYEPRPHRLFDGAMFAYCCLVAVFLVGMMAVSQFAALVRFYPYDLTFGLRHYDFDRLGTNGWAAYYNSIRMAGNTAVAGTVLVFAGAYLVEKTRGVPAVRVVFQLLAMIPMAVPGLVLGLAYIFFFNDPANPLNSLYRTMAILVINTIAHFYTVAHLTAVTALRQMDPEFEAVSASLKQPFYRTFWRVTVPVCLPAILDIGIYLFVNAMTTVSAVVFLWAPGTELASIAVLDMDDAGQTAAAAAMAMMIFYTNVGVRALHVVVARWLDRRTQAWRRR